MLSRMHPSKAASIVRRRRALELLASCADGCTEAILIAHGFTVEQMVELVRIGHATAQTERVIAGGRAIEIARIKITEAGRRALTGKPMQCRTSAVAFPITKLDMLSSHGLLASASAR